MQENYQNTELVFLDIANIHVMRERYVQPEAAIEISLLLCLWVKFTETIQIKSTEAVRSCGSIRCNHREYECGAFP